MTALPEPVEWKPPRPGYWMRNFRLGEWLPEAMTPLFADWLLGLIEDGYLRGMRSTVGTTVPFRYAAINGWYYTTLPEVSPRLLARALLESRGPHDPVLWNALIRVNNDPVGADRAVLRRLADEWRTGILPRYRRLVDHAQERVESANARRAGRDRRGGRHGGGRVPVLAGDGRRVGLEDGGRLAKFVRRHLTGPSGLRLPGAAARPAGCGGGNTSARRAERRLVPSHPRRAGHRGRGARWTYASARDRGRAGSSRRGVPHHPRRPAELLSRFDALLEVAQRYAVLREQQARDFTLAWPLLRRCALRLGESLAAARIIDDAEDVFFLTRAELDAGRIFATWSPTAAKQWERQRRLAAPLDLGVPPKALRSLMHGAAEAARTRPVPSDALLVGEPASPGRASGAVRIVHGPDDFRGFRAGEVLVARLTAPAWTPLFGRAAAVVTDGGTLAAHASLVAREYGIPAVVGAGDATSRLRDGQAVTVDGGAGTVELGH